MSQQTDHLAANQALWDSWTPHHVNSEFYDIEGFKAGKSSLKSIELDLLGDVTGQSILHLQCHFGQDSMSLQRMGAQVTGVDLSSVAMKTARELAAELELESEFICCDVLQLDQHLDKTYDVVYTSYGVIGWLPDLDRWADLIHRFLKPGGKLVLVEFHPVLWMLDDKQEGIGYSYFNAGADIEQLNGSYAAPDSGTKGQSHYWNHSLAESLRALLKLGMQLRDFQEYDTSPYPILSKNVAVNGGFQQEGLEGKLPLVFSMVVEKPA